MDTGLLEGKISHSTEDSLTTVSWSPDGRKITCGGSRGNNVYSSTKAKLRCFFDNLNLHCIKSGYTFLYRTILSM